MRLLIPACLLLLALTGFHALTLGSSARAAVHTDVGAHADAPKACAAPAMTAAVSAMVPCPLLPAAPVAKETPAAAEPAHPVFLGQEVPRSSASTGALWPLGSRTHLVGRAQGFFPLLLRDGVAGDGAAKDGGPRTDSDRAARVELGLRYTF